MNYVYVNGVYVGAKEDATEAYQLAFKYCDANKLPYGPNVREGEAVIRFLRKEEHEEKADAGR